MSFFTGKGDQGTTKLFDSAKGVRVTKTSPIFEALGMLDELNSLVGWCKPATSELHVFETKQITDLLRAVQDCLFTAQAELAGAPKNIPEQETTSMSELINTIEKSLPPVTTFLVAGGSELSARLDIARSVSRRVERRVLALHESGDREVAASTRAYLNRLSSLLYALTRWVNHLEGITEAPPVYNN